ncbi:TPA: hypothetical protein N0F65_005172 [Lagenidium giganteum]|uniref:Uncharacterized protein n=1 Tax=Lagenidium giganteum TaxID=4803 RepID=A0AAV2Z1H5_9STRA|nr:TPA: hypothetical protein N0F65_005172 [Lagenidium giganteum]
MRHPAASYERPPSCQPHQQAQWNAHAFTVENEASAVEVDAESDDAYEYAFVLSDEWRERFVRRRQAEAAAAPVAARDRRIKHGVPKQQRARRSTASRAKNEPSQSGTVNACGGLPARLDQERYESLNAEIAATGATEQARRARAAAAGYSKEGARAISHQEAQLNLRFDTFCDSSAPTLWPAG